MEGREGGRQTEGEEVRRRERSLIEIGKGDGRRRGNRGGGEGEGAENRG